MLKEKRSRRGGRRGKDRLEAKHTEFPDVEARISEKHVIYSVELRETTMTYLK